MKIIARNNKAQPDSKDGHKQRMLEHTCPHRSILMHNTKGIHCETCNIPFAVTYRDGEMTFWIDEDVEELDDLHDPA